MPISCASSLCSIYPDWHPCFCCFVAAPTRILVLTNMVVPEELVNDQEYKEICEDIEIECGKSGQVLAVVIPRPGAPGASVPGLGKVRPCLALSCCRRRALS